MEFVLIEEAPVSLLGLTACQQFGLITVLHESISAVHQCGVIGSTFPRHSRVSLTKDALLERFKSVFDGGVATAWWNNDHRRKNFISTEKDRR